MKKLNASLLIVTAMTGLVLAGCNQKPAETKAPASTTTKTESASGSIKIEESKDKQATGSITISAPVESSKDASLNTKANDTALSAEALKAMEDANKAMEDSKKAVK